MTKSQKDNLVISIFTETKIFEQNVLEVHNNSDRIEIMDILAKKLIRDLLKEELNFLYMKNLDHFDFSLIVNLLFKEIANEWLSYAMDTLLYERDDALELLQEKKNTLFILSLVKEYFRLYKIYFFQEIADSFIDLINNMPSPSVSNKLIDEVLESGFVKNQNISVIYNYSQLWARVKNAQNAKKEEQTKLQLKIAEANDPKIRKRYEFKEEELRDEPLAFFDDALLRLRNAMVQYMMQIRPSKR